MRKFPGADGHSKECALKACGYDSKKADPSAMSR